MAAARICFVCGATNPGPAEWCGQCYARFDEQERSRQQEVAVAVGTSSVPRAGSDARTWGCPICEEDNPVGSFECAICGTSVFEAFRVPQRSVDPAQALLWSVVPGVGLAKAGQGLLGLSTGLLILMAMASGSLFVSAATRALGVVLILIGAALWAISAHDAHRLATGDRTSTLLRPRVVTVTAGVVLGLMTLAFIQTGQQLGQT